MEAENDNKLAFLGSEVLRESDSRLAISEYYISHDYNVRQTKNLAFIVIRHDE